MNQNSNLSATRGLTLLKPSETVKAGMAVAPGPGPGCHAGSGLGLVNTIPLRGTGISPPPFTSKDNPTATVLNSSTALPGGPVAPNAGCLGQSLVRELDPICYNY